jgi:hypothetical protein
MLYCVLVIFEPKYLRHNLVHTWGEGGCDMMNARACRILWIIPFLIAVCFISVPVYAQYGGGTGEPNDPYLIYTPGQLNAISNDVNDWDKHFKLMADLDLEGENIISIGYWRQPDYEPKEPFRGVFDGNGKSISNFKQYFGRKSSESSGLFQYVYGDNSVIKDLTLIDPNVDNRNFAGPLVGSLERGTVRGCSVIGGLVTGINVGGLVGYVKYGTVEDCTVVNTIISGRDHLGGLIGQIRSGVVRDCHSNAEVTGRSDLGGLVGLSKDDTLITGCGATGAVRGTEYFVGGLVGRCGAGSSEGNCIVAGSFASGDVSGDENVGGLAGGLSYSQIICSYAKGHVSGIDNVGGLVGNLAAPRIIDSYSIGQVNGTGENVGGFTGNNWSPAYDCFWDIETSDKTTSGLGRGLTTTQMQDPNTFVNTGWDFVGESTNGPSDIWIMPQGGGYPILWWQVSPLPALPSFSGGTGEPNDPYIISTAEQLNSIGHNPRLMGSHFELANDIDLDDIDVFLIGNESFPFSGVFDGNGFQIQNFSYEASEKYRKNIGLFKYVRGLDAEIKNLILTNSSVINQIETSFWDSLGPENIGSLVGLLYEGIVFNCHIEESEVQTPITFGKNTGGLIGCNWYGFVEKCSSEATVRSELERSGCLIGWNHAGIIFGCNSSGDVYGDYAAGGIAGSNWALIVDCNASGNISGLKNVGGLVGDNFRTIITSASYANVTGSHSVGGLVGRNLGPIENSYARAIVSGNNSVGGLVGDNTYIPRIYGTIVKSYSASFVSGDFDGGGLTYSSHAAATTSDDCFWDIETSGQTSSDGGIGKTTA